MLSQEEILQKADELSKVYGCKVHPLVFVDMANTDERVIGYLKEPPRIVKLRYMDKAILGAASAGAEVIDEYLIKEASDPRILNDDVCYLGAIQELQSVITMAVNQFKKK